VPRTRAMSGLCAQAADEINSAATRLVPINARFMLLSGILVAPDLSVPAQS
jgi:hypothetical protein